MKKIGFVFSCISILTGTIVIMVTSILNQLIPKLGYMAYQNAVGGIYDAGKYTMNFTFVNIMAVMMMFIGFVNAVKLYTKPDDLEDKEN